MDPVSQYVLSKGAAACAAKTGAAAKACMAKFSGAAKSASTKAAASAKSASAKGSAKAATSKTGVAASRSDCGASCGTISEAASP